MYIETADSFSLKNISSTKKSPLTLLTGGCLFTPIDRHKATFIHKSFQNITKNITGLTGIRFVLFYWRKKAALLIKVVRVIDRRRVGSQCLTFTPAIDSQRIGAVNHMRKKYFITVFHLIFYDHYFRCNAHKI